MAEKFPTRDYVVVDEFGRQSQEVTKDGADIVSAALCLDTSLRRNGIGAKVKKVK